MMKRGLFTRRREAAAPPETGAPPAPSPATRAPPTGRPPLAPLARPPQRAHHWLTVEARLRTGAGACPLAGARVVVRPMPPGEVREGDPVARGTTGPAGSAALLLPPGRYTVTAAHGRARRRVLVTIERAGRITITLDADQAPLACVTVEARTHDDAPAAGVPVEARLARNGALAARGVTDARGAAALLLTSGEYDVVAPGASVRLDVAHDADVRLVLPPPPPTPSTRWN